MSGLKPPTCTSRFQNTAGGAQGLPRVLRARWMPTIKAWMDMARL
jgi:hypothetical protein